MRFVAQLRLAWREPVSVLAAFAGEPWAAGLVSGGEGGRWSYVARAPDRVLLHGGDDPADPFSALGALVWEDGERLTDGPPFQGGVIGLAAYELGERLEPLGRARQPEWPDLAAARYPALLAFDHREESVHALGRGETPDAAAVAAATAAGWLSETPRPPAEGVLSDGLEASSGDVYEAAVAELVARIAAGEMFQVNVARSWRGRLRAGATPFDVAARLARQSPAPFAAYLRIPGLALASNSPERFLSVRRDAEGLAAETRPIKGTRPRGATPDADAALAAELAASAKDRAENLMIVDLMRNDLARVGRPGSVAVPDLFALETFANVHHLVSTVTARLAPGQGALELLRAAFPPGSVTGAPKVQAMKRIAELEPPRGPYCGSMFWAGADGALDSSVLIRTVACVEEADGWRLEARAGGGIVADSDPVAERLETEAKIAAIVRALTEPA